MHAWWFVSNHVIKKTLFNVKFEQIINLKITMIAFATPTWNGSIIFFRKLAIFFIRNLLGCVWISAYMWPMYNSRIWRLPIEMFSLFESLIGVCISNKKILRYDYNYTSIKSKMIFRRRRKIWVFYNIFYNGMTVQIYGLYMWC